MSHASKSIEAVILDLFARRPPGATICPSEVARALRPENWRAAMPEVRAVADDLVARGMIEITQHGQAVNRAQVKGPIRLRRHAESSKGRMNRTETVEAVSLPGCAPRAVSADVNASPAAPSTSVIFTQRVDGTS